MTTDAKWKKHCENARSQISLPEKEDIESYIELTCEPSFTPIINLQLVWRKNDLRWHKSEWDFAEDWNVFYHTDGVARAIFRDIKPAIKIESGKADLSILAGIKKQIADLRIPPIVDDLKMFTLDGSITTISFGVDRVKTSYSWHTLPDEWKYLDLLVENLIVLRDQLT